MQLGSKEYILQGLEGVHNNTTTKRRVPTLGQMNITNKTSALNLTMYTNKIPTSKPQDKLPCLIQCVYNLDLQFETIHPEMLSVAIEDSMMAQQIKTVLYNSVDKLLEAFPSGWKKVYIHTYIHTYILTYMYIHTYIHIHIHTYILTYILTYIHTYIHIHIHTWLHTHVHTYVCTYIHTYTCLCIQSYM